MTAELREMGLSWGEAQASAEGPCGDIHTHTHKHLLEFIVNQAGNRSKLNNDVFISIFILAHIVGHLEKQDVVILYWIPVHSDDRYGTFAILSAYGMRRHGIMPTACDDIMDNTNCTFIILNIHICSLLRISDSLTL